MPGWAGKVREMGGERKRKGMRRRGGGTSVFKLHARRARPVCSSWQRETDREITRRRPKTDRVGGEKVNKSV